jgi:hypothetical protein
MKNTPTLGRRVFEQSYLVAGASAGASGAAAGAAASGAGTAVSTGVATVVSAGTACSCTGAGAGASAAGLLQATKATETKAALARTNNDFFILTPLIINKFDFTYKQII